MLNIGCIFSSDPTYHYFMTALWKSTQEFGRKFLGYNNETEGKLFLLAADTGDIEKILECISRNGVSYQDEYGQRPLHRASRRNHFAAVRMLLEYGSDPNAKDSVGGYTAVQYAAHYNHPQIVRLLVSYGADVFYQNRIAKPVTHYASKYPRIRQSIQQGLSDLYIHRSIAANYILRYAFGTKSNCAWDYSYFEEYMNDIEIGLPIVLKIVEYLPRHQLPTEV